MSNIQVNGNYITSGKNTVTQIKIDYFERNQKNIPLVMVAADTQSASRDTYRLINPEKFMYLMNDESIEVKTNFHC